jgi:hypothetical protein
VGLTLFFRFVPAGKEGLLFGLIMSLGELVRIYLFPLLASPLPPDAWQRFSLYAVICWSFGVTGLVLGAAYTAPAVSP